MTASIPLHAWVDESMHQATEQLPAGIYILAATIADPTRCEPVREGLRTLLAGSNKRLHWRDESPRRQRQIAAAIAEYNTTHTVVIGAPLDHRRQERARRLCLQRLLYELTLVGVTDVWLEARTASLNRKDITMVAALRSSGAVPSHLRVEPIAPTEEPMLWIPDAVAGVVGSYRRRGDETAYLSLRRRMTEHDIRLM